MKKFAIAFAALAALTFVSNVTFAAEPFCGTSSYYNSKYNNNTRYDYTASRYDRRYNDSYYRANDRDYLDRYRTTAPYNSSLTDRLNSLYSTYSNRPLFNDVNYRSRTNYNTFKANLNNYDHYDRYDCGTYDPDLYNLNRLSNSDWRYRR
ncbi:hypothetical protein F1728_14880 [Gimesia benthica]|uniref:Uncharacterized protein n=1 Tax=Gimesia benthica TaxID=2608982 RepID=A0A6I6ABY6_9PLAN|nr:hypothetical protein [Gimesia benthica]QGQ23887.1 hypothetical protein F1728_14880 [Gimesia benthica]